VSTVITGKIPAARMNCLLPLTPGLRVRETMLKTERCNRDEENHRQGFADNLL